MHLEHFKGQAVGNQERINRVVSDRPDCHTPNAWHRWDSQASRHCASASRARASSATRGYARTGTVTLASASRFVAMTARSRVVASSGAVTTACRA